MQQLFTELRPLYETTKDNPHVIAFFYENGVGRGTYHLSRLIEKYM